MIKTTKSYAKRLKVTRNGKIIARKPGQNHFNAKESSNSQRNKRRSAPLAMSNKDKARFLVNL
jgi:ribosomal protein L35